ncbi:MAG: DUF4837 family protein [Candidatus Eisenbacteria bacterium]|nr:DUF4837 family protein [Candidatus Eisenbacteria bacterium]
MARPNRVRFLLALSLLHAGMISVSCERLMPALGSYDEIHVIADRRPSEEVMKPLRETFEIPFETVQEETLFHLNPVASKDLAEVDSRKNYLVLVDLSERGPAFHLAQKTLGAAPLDEAGRSGKASYLFVDNAIARYQTHAFLIAERASAFPQAARANGRAIRDGFLQSNRRRILEFLLFRGENLTLARTIHERFGWTIQMPAPFEESAEHVDAGFFSMKMDRPGRLLFVYWADGCENLPDTSRVVALRDSLGMLYYDEDYVERSRTTAFMGTFQGRPAVRVHGLWQNEKYTIGGPFRSIAFRDENRGRLYLLDYAVYAPGIAKKYYLWELESVIETFRTGSPPAAPSPRTGAAS